MTARIDMGMDGADNPVLMDLEELLATRLLVQGNSGSGKSHLLRRLLEGSAGLVQQIVIDPEGDFVSLSEAFGHVVLDAGEHSEHEINRIGARIREHRASVVLSLEGLDIDAQMRCAGGFLNALFDAPRDHWYPALVVVDEAQMFAPVAAGEFSEEARRASLGAMTNLMCRGRKRGLAGVIATQRLAKLAKNVAAEASNFLMGRTFLDIDMARAADLLGMERRQAEQIRDLERGRFLALGPAVSRRPIAVRIGEVKTGARGGTPKLTPLPTAAPEDLESLLFARMETPPPPPPPPPPRITSEDLIRSIARPNLQPAAPAPAPAGPQMEEGERAAIIAAVLAEIAADPDATYRTAAVLYQDFGLRCRMRQLADPGLDLAQFRKRLAMARAGLFDESDESWTEALELASQLPEDMLGAFLLIARAAKESAPCPSDTELAEIYGTRSPGRVRRMLSYIESRGLLVARVDLSGKRTLTLPNLGWTTAPAIPETDQPMPMPARGGADMGSLL